MITSREQAGAAAAETAAAALVDRMMFVTGTTIVLTAGAYGDFCVSDCLVTSMDCDLPALAELYVCEINPDGRAYQDRTDEFAIWLIARHYAVRSRAETVHLGDYSMFGANLVPARATAPIDAEPA